MGASDVFTNGFRFLYSPLNDWSHVPHCCHTAGASCGNIFSCWDLLEVSITGPCHCHPVPFSLPCAGTRLRSMQKGWPFSTAALRSSRHPSVPNSISSFLELDASPGPELGTALTCSYCPLLVSGHQLKSDLLTESTSLCQRFCFTS